MHRSSESIGAIAAALAKAQGELTNPEKSLSATIRSPFPPRGGPDLPLCFSGQWPRYRPQEPGPAGDRHHPDHRDRPILRADPAHDHVLAHASGEWISSEWPVCAVSEMAAPQRMGAALTYARRYALFALVGIAGEDDLDAPDILVEPSPTINALPAPIAAAILFSARLTAPCIGHDSQSRCSRLRHRPACVMNCSRRWRTSRTAKRLLCGRIDVCLPRTR